LSGTPATPIEEVSTFTPLRLFLDFLSSGAYANFLSVFYIAECGKTGMQTERNTPGSDKTKRDADPLFSLSFFSLKAATNCRANFWKSELG
jgi:hypothetical protein